MENITVYEQCNKKVKFFLSLTTYYNRNYMYFLHSIFKNGGTNMHLSSWQFHFNIPKCSFGKKNPQLRFLNPSTTRSLPRTCNHHFLQLYNLISYIQSRTRGYPLSTHTAGTYSIRGVKGILAPVCISRSLNFTPK